MFDRPYKCPVCFSVFRTESGMKSHLTRSHETPTALEGQSKLYESRLHDMEGENAKLRIQLEEANRNLQCAMNTQMQGLEITKKIIQDNSRLKGELDSMNLQLTMLMLSIVTPPVQQPAIASNLPIQNNIPASIEATEKPQPETSNNVNSDSNSTPDIKPLDI